MVSKSGRYDVRNIERQHNECMGGEPSGYDRGCVIDTTTTERHPLTGASQHKAVFFGTLTDCWAWVHGQEEN